MTNMPRVYLGAYSTAQLGMIASLFSRFSGELKMRWSPRGVERAMWCCYAHVVKQVRGEMACRRSGEVGARYLTVPGLRLETVLGVAGSLLALCRSVEAENAAQPVLDEDSVAGIRQFCTNLAAELCSAHGLAVSAAQELVDVYLPRGK